MNMQSGVAFRASGLAKVAAEEKVTTPAGTFDTYRIDTTVRLINTRDQTKSSTWTFIYWYAPAVPVNPLAAVAAGLGLFAHLATCAQ
jgi:hypothetical protein